MENYLTRLISKYLNSTEHTYSYKERKINISKHFEKMFSKYYFSLKTNYYFKIQIKGGLCKRNLSKGTELLAQTPTF